VPERKSANELGLNGGRVKATQGQSRVPYVVGTKN
jgi:hypothetical protein